ncbi:MAG TPA: translation initiation factor IF-2, partial [Verrucomicrobia bacterium]|nr:translation initiation factor IF-2 [Verrucomicrobiota bacterium]
GLRSESSESNGNSGTASASKKAKPKFKEPTSGEIITLKPPIIVRDLAGKLNRKPFQLIADLMEMGVFANVNQAIEEDIAKQVCAKYGRRFDLEKRERGAGVIKPQEKPVTLDFEDKEDDLRARAPVVTIMGHVDHGKTTLLDSIRKSNVVAKEAGGITQHIGAYTIDVPHPDNPKKLKQITFLDTPGHAAFSAMRARGANVTDIVILVVAATDGVMPQTVEALNHAKQAQVPIIVAVNKCDHPNANPMQTRQQLQEHEIVCEEWGGHTIFQDLSALSGEGVNKLLDLLLLQAEIMELTANPNRTAIGNVVESGIDPGGPTATVLVRKGTLKTGDAVICGPFYGKVRALINEQGKRIREAGPSVAVKLLGLNGAPSSGLEFNAVKNEKKARALAQEREDNNRLKEVESRKKITLENLFDTLTSNAAKLLKVIVKADTQGSAEAIVDSLNKIESEKVSIEVIHNAVGTVTSSDVLLASASTAIVIGFHTRLDKGVAKLAKQEGVQIKLYSIIYELVEEIKDAMAGLLDPLSKEVPTGKAEIRQVFELTKGSKVAGCMVTSGKFGKGKVRVLRNKEMIFKGTTQSVRHFQDEVNEVRSGFECGIRIDGFDKFKEGDEIESFKIEKVRQGL